jgi:guanine deaminase
MVAGDIVVRAGALTRIDEAALLAEIEAEFLGLADRFRAAEASAAPLLAAVEAIYRRSLAVAIPADTLIAKLPGNEAKGN